MAHRGLRRLERGLQRLRARAPSGTRLWSALGVLSASVILVNVNVLSARFYERWDWTDARAFTLSAATSEILASLTEPVDVVVFLSRSDRLLIDVRHMLAEYQAHTRQLHTTFVDPDRNPAQFLALQQKYGIAVGKSQDGKVLTDTSIVIARGNEHWFLTPEDLMGLDSEGNVEPRLEKALTEGIAEVTRGEQLTVCFTTGHQEASIDDVGPQGLAELRMRLETSNFKVETVDLGKANPAADALEACAAVAVVGPAVMVGARAAELLKTYFLSGGSVLLMLDPLVDQTGSLGKSGLEPVARAAGVELQNNFVIERDPELRLPNGFGEAFLATPESHAVTEGLIRSGVKVDFRVLVVGTQALGTSEGSPAKPLLVSSKQSFALDDLSSVQKGDRQLVPLSDSESGPYYVALASESNSPPADAKSKGGEKRRMVVVGAVNPAWARNWRDPTLIGDRLFVENAFSWLTARPALVSVPKQRSFPAGLSLTEDSLTDVLTYVMLYMPLTAAFMGGFVLVRRRKKEQREISKARKRRST